MTAQTTKRTDGTGAFADILEHSNASYGADAQRKAMLADTQAPYHVLAAHGIEVPHREYIDDPEEVREFPTTATLPDGTKVHLHQDVREQTEEFGDFGAIDTDSEDIIWTVVDLTDETVTLTVVGDWSKRRHVPYEEFTDEYDPIYLDDGIPQFGY